VGELAERTGLTVRTLHHYDEIGLLRPSHRSGAGHRLYGAEDLGRLLQILSLRQAGLSLEEIRECLTRPDLSLQRVLDEHVSRLREGIARQQRLCDRLSAVAERLRSTETVSVEELITTMEAIVMFEKHYTEEQLQTLAARRQQLGEARIREVEAEWPVLIAQVRAEMDKGTDPASDAVQRLAARWQALVDEFTGGDPGIARSAAKVLREEPAAQERTGIDAAIFDYIGRAMAARRGSA
jgi:DNA-binding transcriptional MerR regulator